MATNGLNVINNGAPTRVAYNVETAIDLTIVTPILEPLMEWRVMSSPNDSDHLPVVITVMNNREQNEENQGRDIKKAN